MKETLQDERNEEEDGGQSKGFRIIGQRGPGKLRDQLFRPP